MPQLSYEECYSRLATSVFLKGIDLQDFIRLAKCWNASTRTFAPKEIIYRISDKENPLAVLVEGHTQVVQSDFLGVRALVKETRPGEILGVAVDNPSFSDIIFSVVAVEESTVLFLDYRRFRTPCANPCPFHTRVLLNHIDILFAEQGYLLEHLVNLSRRTTREKLLSFLMQQAAKNGENAFTVPLSRQELADYLCVDRSAMSTELGRMRSEGLIDYQGNQFSLRRDVVVRKGGDTPERSAC